MQTESLRLEWRTPAELAENPRNWRSHPPQQLAALTGAIAEVGWAGACLYNEATGRLIDGHARKKVALEQGCERVPVLIGSWTEEQEAKILLTLDPLAAMADADTAKLDALLREVQTSNEDLASMLTELAQQAHIIPADATSPGSLPNNDAVETPGEDLEWGEEPEDDFDLLFKSPYPYFGGKSRVAGLVWKYFGDLKSYIEPFFGSGAVLLNRPQPFEGVETVNDFDALICNFWRALKADPDKVAELADWPINENDANARHAWLVGQKDSLQARVEGDPEYFDVKIAGWWVWGMACWIGGGFCSGNGPWQVVEEEDGSRNLVHLGSAGQGVNRNLVHLGSAGQGVNRKLVQLGSAGRGVNRKLVHLGSAGQAGLGEHGLLEWMRALAERFRRVRVCCGDWKRVCGGNSGDALAHFFVCGEPCGVFLDPPYSTEADRDMGCYRVDDGDVAHAVREWAIAHGDDPRLRICLAGYQDEHDMPSSWKKIAWKAQGGMANQGDNRGKANAYRERLWFSPHCLGVTDQETT
jgi:D12 class N6 adenine-specific DNA methyltransferase